MKPGSAGMPRNRRHLAILALVSLFHAFLLLVWIRLDGISSEGVCCEKVVGLTGLLQDGRWTLDQGLLPLLPWALHPLLGWSSDLTLYSVLLASVAAGVLAFMVGRHVAGVGAGLFSAALLPAIPVMAFAYRRWDVYGPQAPLLLLGALFLLRSRGLSRPLPSIGLALVFGAAAMFSPLPTDNLLLLLALGSMTGAAFMRSVILGRDGQGEQVSRVTCLVGLAPLLGLLCLLAWLWADLPWGGELGVSTERYLNEALLPSYQAAFPWWHWRHLGAYLAHLYWRGLTPWLALPLELAMVLYLWRGRYKAEILGWTAGPLLVLSLIPKKNFYYASVVHPALPIILAAGIATISWRRVRGMAAGGILLVAMIQLLQRSFPRILGHVPLPTVAAPAWQAGDPYFGGLFQGTDHNLYLGPRPDCWAAATAEFVAEYVSGDSCEMPQDLFLLGFRSEAELLLELMARVPCLRVEARGWERGIGEGDMILAKNPGKGAAFFRKYGVSMNLEQQMRYEPESRWHVVAPTSAAQWRELEAMRSDGLLSTLGSAEICSESLSLYGGT